MSQRRVSAAMQDTSSPPSHRVRPQLSQQMSQQLSHHRERGEGTAQGSRHDSLILILAAAAQRIGFQRCLAADPGSIAAGKAYKL